MSEREVRRAGVSARTAPFQPVLETLVHLHQLAEVRSSRPLLPVRLLLPLSRPQLRFQHPAPQRLRIRHDPVVGSQMFRRQCLLHMVDDATGTRWATFASQETTWRVADTLRGWVEKYGVPRALYVDGKTVYHHQPTVRQKQEGIVPVSQFGRMCAKVGNGVNRREFAAGPGPGGTWARDASGPADQEDASQKDRHV